MLSYKAVAVALYGFHILFLQDYAKVKSGTVSWKNGIPPSKWLRKKTTLDDIGFQVMMYSLSAIPYKSADHYWPLTKIDKMNKIVKDECGKTNANVSNGVTTKKDIQLGTVVSLNTNNGSLVMTPFESRCISDPFYCEEGITIEFWLRYHSGECILSSGGYTKRRTGPGFMLKYNSTINCLTFVLSTRTQQWSVQFKEKISSWVHLMLLWKRTRGVFVYENGEFLTKDETGEDVWHPSFSNKYNTLAIGDPRTFMKLRSGGRFEIGHLVIWIRRLLDKEIQTKAFMAVVAQNRKSRQCCGKMQGDPCIVDGCFYDEIRCSNIGQKYPCICPKIKMNRTCGNAPAVGLSFRVNDDSKILIVAIAVGVTCVLMLLVTIALVIARMNNKRQGEFIPGNNDNVSGSITADPNTQEMIAASVDPAPRITDVPFKSPKVKKSTKVNLRKPEHMTSHI